MRVALFFNLIDPKWVSLSMERYGHELKKNLEKIQGEGLEIISFQPKIPKILGYLPTKWRFKVSRFYYYSYFSGQHEGDVNHIVDHSFAQVSRLLKKNKTIVTCHDLIPLKKLPDGTRVEKDDFALQSFRESVSYLKDVGMIIADSEATKKDLISLLSIPEEQVKVVYLGRNESFKTGVGTEEINKRINPQNKPIILHVGHNMAYKNIEGILAALKIIKEKGPDYIFVKVGPAFSPNQNDLVERYGLSDNIVHAGFLSEKDLIALYNHASVLVYPSLFEGFGLPVLEALSCGLPVVVSKDTSLTEITGDVGEKIDPTSAEEIAAALIKIINTDADQLEELKASAVAQAEKFSWEKTARQTLEVYRQVYEKQ